MDYFDSFDCQLQCEDFYDPYSYYGISNEGSYFEDFYNLSADTDTDKEMLFDEF